MRRVLLFSNTADPSRAARVHAESCPLVAAARKSRGKVKIITTDIEATIRDLNEREFPVKECRCTREPSR